MRIRTHSAAATLFAGIMTITACGAERAADPVDASIQQATPEADTELVSSEATVGGLFDTSVVHSISVTADADDLAAAVATYLADGDKEWVQAEVTIDGVTYSHGGMRLKGNSSLRNIDADTPAESLPWKISLDKYVDGQHANGITEFAIRSNTSATALNEAVALDLLNAAGVPAEDATYVALSVNGSPETLRLVVELPDDAWMQATFTEPGALYKAESSGDYTYRGDDPEAYDDVFDQEAGTGDADLTPLIEFLDFINNADDSTFAAELPNRLDVDGFADYLAMMDIVDNFDDIDGPGNNSYLYYDATNGRFSVVAWDLNLAFGLRPAGGPRGDGAAGPGPAGAAPGGRPAPPDNPPEGGAPNGDGAGGPNGAGAGGPNGGGRDRSNVLADRFRSVPQFAALYDQAVADLSAALIDGGVIDASIADRAAVVEASGLVDAATITSESAAISDAAGAPTAPPTQAGNTDDAN